MTNVPIIIKKKFSAICVLIIFNISILKGTYLEDDAYESHSLKIVLHEDLLVDPLLENSFFLRFRDTVRPNSDEIIELGALQNGAIEENPTNRFSNSYIRAFQQETNEGVSRSEALKYFISFIGSFGPVIPQIPIAMIMAREHFHSDEIGYAMIGIGILSISTINTWMINELIDDSQSFFKGARGLQNNASMFSFSSLKNIGLGVSCIFLGCLGSAPSVFLNYKYNESIPYAAITFVYEAIPKIVGYYKFSSLLSVDSLKRLFKDPDPEERRAAQILTLSQAYFLKKCKENGTEDLRLDLSRFTSPDEIYSYLSNGEFSIEELPPEFARGIPKKIIKYSSIIFPLISSGFPSALSYAGYKSIFNDEALPGIFTALSVAPIFFLSSYAFMHVVENIYDRLFSCRLPIPSSDYLTNFHPKLNVAFTCTTFLISSVSALVLYFLFMDNTEEMLSPAVQYPIAITTVVTGFVFDSFTINNSLKRHGEFMYRKFSKGAAYVLGCKKKLIELGQSLYNYGSGFIRSFVNTILPVSEDTDEEKIDSFVEEIVPLSEDH